MSSGQNFRAYFFKTFVKAYIYCEKPMPSEADSVPGSTNYQYNVIRKYIYCCSKSSMQFVEKISPTYISYKLLYEINNPSIHLNFPCKGFGIIFTMAFLILINT